MYVQESWAGGAQKKGNAGCGRELQWSTGTQVCGWDTEQGLPIANSPSKDNKGTAFSLLLAA